MTRKNLLKYTNIHKLLSDYCISSTFKTLSLIFTTIKRVIPIIQMRKLRLRVDKCLAQDPSPNSNGSSIKI